MLAAAAVVLAGVTGSLVMAVATALAAAERVRGAADLVAVSAAAEYASGSDACLAAARIATANRVELRECSVVGDELDFAVTVVVGMPADGRPGLLPADFASRAHAGWLVTGG